MLPDGYNFWAVALLDSSVPAVLIYFVPAVDSDHAIVKARYLRGDYDAPVVWTRPLTNWIEGQQAGVVTEAWLHWDGATPA